MSSIQRICVCSLKKRGTFGTSGTNLVKSMFLNYKMFQSKPNIGTSFGTNNKESRKYDE